MHSRTTLVNTIQTIAAVARIKWRPQRKFQIARLTNTCRHNHRLIHSFLVNYPDHLHKFTNNKGFQYHTKLPGGVLKILSLLLVNLCR